MSNKTSFSDNWLNNEVTLLGTS